MRILQVGPIPPEVGGQTGGGVATHLWSLAVHLKKQGHTVAILSDNYYSEALSPESREGIHIFGLRGLLRSAWTAYILCPSFWIKGIRTKLHFGTLMTWKGVLAGLLNYRRVIKAFQPDLIHIHHLEFRFPFVTYLVGDRIPILTTVHSTSFLEFSPSSAVEKRKEFIRRNLDLSQNLIFVSQFLENRFEILFPGVLKGKNTTIIHNPVNGSIDYSLSTTEAREKLGIESAGPVLLFVGNLIPQKRLELLIEAAKLISDRGLDFQVRVVGSGPEQAELERLVQKYQLSEKVVFEGQISQEELFLYYNAADLLVSPSPMESFGLVFVEAMLCGCPVLGRPGVLQEILPSERCGVYLPSSNPEVWAEGILEALDRSWSRGEISELARVYTWDAIQNQFEGLYRQLTS